jgi:hypothetical protein
MSIIPSATVAFLNHPGVGLQRVHCVAKMVEYKQKMVFFYECAKCIIKGVVV